MPREKREKSGDGLRLILFVTALLLLITGCSRQEQPQGNISPSGNHYERAMQLCETNHYAEAELILKEGDRKSTRLNSSHPTTSRMPSSA